MILQIADSQAGELAWPNTLKLRYRFFDTDPGYGRGVHFALRRNVERLEGHRKEIGIGTRLADVELDQQCPFIILDRAIPPGLDGQPDIGFWQFLFCRIELSGGGRELGRPGDHQRCAHLLIARDAELLALEPTDFA